MKKKVTKVCPICSESFVCYEKQKTCSLKCSYIQRGIDGTNDLLGERFGQLVVIEYIGSVNDKVRWLCQCDCGEKYEVNSGDLTRKDSRKLTNCSSRVHRSGENSAHWMGEYGISATYWGAVQKGAASRELDFSINIKYAASKFTGYCELSGLRIELNTTASLDRIDSSKGYIEGNIQWLHKDVNRIKSDLDEDYFILLTSLIWENKKRKIFYES